MRGAPTGPEPVGGGLSVPLLPCSLTTSSRVKRCFVSFFFTEPGREGSGILGGRCRPAARVRSERSRRPDYQNALAAHKKTDAVQRNQLWPWHRSRVLPALHHLVGDSSHGALRALASPEMGCLWMTRHTKASPSGHVQDSSISMH